MLAKQHREALLTPLNSLDHYPVNKILLGKMQLPKDFVDMNCIFVHVPKCAGTSIKNAFFRNKVHGHMPVWFYEKCNKEFYPQAFKFTFVRHPLSRAYSAYQYLKGTDIDRNSSLKKVVEKYENFDYFVSNWLSSENSMRHILFTPQIKFLENSMGLIDFDFIGKQENFEQDFQNIRMALNSKAELVHMNASVKDSIKREFRPDTIQKIYEIYKNDFDLLGYK